ncbi:MAG: hypothetical protein RLZZ426_308 [Actinomycetota bacterium]|jgi:hypothetical protein
MKVRIAVAAITIAAFSYVALSVLRVQQFLQTSSVIGAVIAVSIIVVITVSGLLIAREIRFGFSMSQMAHVLEAEQGLLIDELPKTPAGRVEREAADLQFEIVKKELELAPDSWRAWYRVAIAYDDARDRTRARAAMRTAEKLFRQQSR